MASEVTDSFARRIAREEFSGSQSLTAVEVPIDLLAVAPTCSCHFSTLVQKTLGPWSSLAYNAMHLVLEIIMEDGNKKICDLGLGFSD